ncbi:20383_t:CDS:1, partial [Dentiscutata erythropus]
ERRDGRRGGEEPSTYSSPRLQAPPAYTPTAPPGYSMNGTYFLCYDG